MRYSHLAFVLLAAGCRQHWEPPLEQPTPMKPSDAVLIWSSGTVEKWHGRQNVTSDSGRRSRRPRCRVRSVFSCPRVDRRDVLVRRGFGGQPPNKRLKLAGAHKQEELRCLAGWPFSLRLDRLAPAAIAPAA